VNDDFDRLGFTAEKARSARRVDPGGREAVSLETDVSIVGFSRLILARKSAWFLAVSLSMSTAGISIDDAESLAKSFAETDIAYSRKCQPMIGLHRAHRFLVISSDRLDARTHASSYSGAFSTCDTDLVFSLSLSPPFFRSDDGSGGETGA
jgi:hypothetical protein